MKGAINEMGMSDNENGIEMKRHLYSQVNTRDSLAYIYTTYVVQAKEWQWRQRQIEKIVANERLNERYQKGVEFDQIGKK